MLDHTEASTNVALSDVLYAICGIGVFLVSSPELFTLRPPCSNKLSQILCPPPPCESNALVKATVGVVSVKFWDFSVALARGRGWGISHAVQRDGGQGVFPIGWCGTV